MKIAVITGEESGDKLAASAIRELKLQYKENIYLFGIGGNALKNQGIDNLFDISAKDSGIGKDSLTFIL